MKLTPIIIVVFMIVLCGCQPEQSLTPTVQVTPTSTDSPRWMIYEKALSRAIVQKEDGLCEWEILGQSNDEVYVWAYCKVREPIGTAASIPIVIQLGKNGEIEKVTIPRDGNNYPIDIRALFPEDVQQKIFPHSVFDSTAAKEHIDERLKSNGPPSIAISGTTLP